MELGRALKIENTCRNPLIPATERTPMALIAEFPAPDELVCGDNIVPSVKSHPSVTRSPRFKQSLVQTNPMLQRFGTPGNSRQKKISKLVVLPRLLYRRIHLIDWLIVERIQICCFRPDPLALGRAPVIFLFYNPCFPNSENIRTCSGSYHFYLSRPRKEPLAETSSSSHPSLFLWRYQMGSIEGSPGPIDTPASRCRGGGGLYISEYLMALGNDLPAPFFLLPLASPVYSLQDISAHSNGSLQLPSSRASRRHRLRIPP